MNKYHDLKYHDLNNELTKRLKYELLTAENVQNYVLVCTFYVCTVHAVVHRYSVGAGGGWRGHTLFIKDAGTCT